MTQENKTPALYALVPPLTDADACARFTELTIEYPATALIGTLWLSMAQFKSAMTDSGWRLDEIRPYMESESATTYVINAERREQGLKLLMNSFAGGYIQILNSIMTGHDKGFTPTPPPKPSPPTKPEWIPPWHRPK